MKIITLVIASYDRPFYAGLMDQWKRIMTVHPDVSCYFIVNDASRFEGKNESLRSMLLKEEHTIFFNDVESGIPGVFQKTAHAISFLAGTRDDWKSVDYVIRTNLSSFYVWDRLVQRLEHQPRTNLVIGDLNRHHDRPYPSGCGVVMSRDVAEKLVPYCFHERTYRIHDDRMIGFVLDVHHIPVVNGERFTVPRERDDMLEVFDDYVLKAIPSTVYHVRTRCGDDSFRERMNVEIYRRLVDAFYP